MNQFSAQIAIFFSDFYLSLQAKYPSILNLNFWPKGKLEDWKHKIKISTNLNESKGLCENGLGGLQVFFDNQILLRLGLIVGDWFASGCLKIPGPVGRLAIKARHIIPVREMITNNKSPRLDYCIFKKAKYYYWTTIESNPFLLILAQHKHWLLGVNTA